MRLVWQPGLDREVVHDGDAKEVYFFKESLP